MKVDDNEMDIEETSKNIKELIKKEFNLYVNTIELLGEGLASIKKK